MINIIAAVSQNGFIGLNGKMPWKCPSDLKFFAATTKNSTVIMGRKTFESIGRPLPNRRNIVISKAPPTDDHPDIKWESEIDLAVPEFTTGLAKDRQLFVIGGASLYDYFIGFADRMYITRILSDVDGDVRFPEVNWSMWKAEDSNPPIMQGPNDQYPMQFLTYHRW